MTWYERLFNSIFGGSTENEPYLGLTPDKAYLPAASLPALYNPSSGGYTTHLNQNEFATPEAAQAVASALGGQVAAPAVFGGAPTTGFLPSGKAASVPSQQQVIIPGMAGTQNAGLLYKTMKDAAKSAYKGPVSNLANNVGQTESVYLIGSLAVPYDVWAKWHATIHTETNTH